MRFAKLHGLGNDFLLLDLRAGGDPLPARRALELCDRHRGVGGDGVLTLLPGARMLVQNADGSVPEMCGNGARCAALWIATEGCTRPASARVELLTDAGPRPCKVDATDPRRGLVEYVLLGGINDSPEDPRALAALLDPARVKVDLIDVNGAIGGFRRSTREARSAFLDVLSEARLPFAVRYSGGQEIGAGCGQLAAGGGRRGARVL
jgi:hypothetical protein